MDPYATSHFSDNALMRDLDAAETRIDSSTAVLLSRLAEVDARKLYRKLGFESMYEYCRDGRRYSEPTTCKRITAARAARRFPLLFLALAEGRLRLSGVVMLTPHLTELNVGELVAAASNMTGAQVTLLIAERFPRPDLPERLRPLPLVTIDSPIAAIANLHSARNVEADSAATCQPGLDPVDRDSPGNADGNGPAPVPQALRPVAPHSAWNVETPAPRPRLTPLAPQRFGFQCTFDQETYDLLQDVRALMGHEVPTGELVQVLKGALRLAKAQLEKRKFAATSRPRPRPAHQSKNPRHIPAHVKRAVRERDGGRCTFVSEQGRGCTARGRVEFDHETPVALGGESTVANLRLRCRAHNQLEAERVFGAAFMDDKRAAARNAAAAAREPSHARRPGTSTPRSSAHASAP